MRAVWRLLPLALGLPMSSITEGVCYENQTPSVIELMGRPRARGSNRQRPAFACASTSIAFIRAVPSCPALTRTARVMVLIRWLNVSHLVVVG